MKVYEVWKEKSELITYMISYLDSAEKILLKWFIILDLKIYFEWL